MKKITLLVCSCLIAAALQAQIHHVPADYNTIQDGINAANPGDTVLVADGTYVEQINFKGKAPLMVASQFIMDGDESHIANTIIDGSQITDPDTASVVLFVSGEDSTSVLYGFTVTGGHGTHDYYPTLVGGGIYARNSGLCLRHNIITGNSLNDENFPDLIGVDGGGIFIDNNVDTWCIIEYNEISYNSITTSHSECGGGGMGVVSNARVTANIFRGNSCHQLSIDPGHYNYGGGLASGSYPDPPQELWLQNNLFDNNTLEGIEGSGAGASATAPGKISCTGNTFIGNSMTGPEPQENGGGGLILWNVEALSPVEGNSFIGNESTHVGGGLAIVNSEMIVQNNIFSGNQAEDAGGGLFVQNNDLIVDHLAILINNTFSGNGADNGGAVYSYNASPLIFNCIFWQDEAYTGDEITTSGGIAEIAWSNIDENGISGQWIQGNGIMNEDPLFYDNTYLEPRCESPCIDQGVLDYSCSHGDTYDAPEYDINGEPRPLDGGVDLGAYESCVGVGIEDQLAVGSRQLAVSVYPNPTSGSSQFAVRSSQSGQLTLEIYDLQGRKVAAVFDGNLPAGVHTIQFDASELPAGIYVYRFAVGGQRSAVGKLIKF